VGNITDLNNLSNKNNCVSMQVSFFEVREPYYIAFVFRVHVLERQGHRLHSILLIQTLVVFAA
jgi:hypothetical protein